MEFHSWDESLLKFSLWFSAAGARSRLISVSVRRTTRINLRLSIDVSPKAFACRGKSSIKKHKRCQRANELGRHLGTLYWYSRNSEETFLQLIDFSNLINFNWMYQLVCSLSLRLDHVASCAASAFQANRLYCDSRSQYIPIRMQMWIISFTVALIYCIRFSEFYAHRAKNS